MRPGCKGAQHTAPHKATPPPVQTPHALQLPVRTGSPLAQARLVSCHSRALHCTCSTQCQRQKPPACELCTPGRWQPASPPSRRAARRAPPAAAQRPRRPRPPGRRPGSAGRSRLRLAARAPRRSPPPRAAPPALRGPARTRRSSPRGAAPAPSCTTRRPRSTCSPGRCVGSQARRVTSGRHGLLLPHCRCTAGQRSGGRTARPVAALAVTDTALLT
jgi:hypothetical protein